jgi:hypothetical protein
MDIENPQSPSNVEPAVARVYGVFDLLVKATAILLFTVVSAWAAWVSNSVHTVSIKQEQVESKMDILNYKMDLLLSAHSLVPGIEPTPLKVK